MSDEPQKLERLNESLYSRSGYRAPSDTRSVIAPNDTAEANADWQSQNLDDMLTQERRKNTEHSFLKKVLVFAIVFCALAFGLAAFIYIRGGNLVSSKNVDISVQAPVSISAGDTVDLGITVTNKNSADLTNASLSIDFPDGTKDPESPSSPLAHKKLTIGTLAAGKSITLHQSVLVFGAKGEVKEFPVTVQYVVTGSNATFTKAKVYELSISSSPVTIDVSRPDSVVSGDAFTTTITVQSNATDVIRGLALRAEYPYGFGVTSVTPDTDSKDKNLWQLGDVSPGDKKVITIKGALVGEDADERTFRFSAGVVDADGMLTTKLSDVSETVALNRPDVSLGILFNNESSNPYVAPAGTSIRTTLRYANNLPSTLLHTRIVARLAGASLDRFSVLVDGGFYNSSDNTITWDESTVGGLASLAPGQSGSVSFNFTTQNNVVINQKNPEITVSSSLMSSPQGGSSSDAVSVKTDGVVRLASQVSLSSKSLYSRGPFKNSGSLPPRAEKPTTYTVVLDLGNTQNEISDGVVRGLLGPNVVWVGAASSSEAVAYDASSNAVTWSVGTLATGAGFSGPGREAAFQVKLTPSIGQIGSVPILFSNPMFTGTDTFTKKPIYVTNSSVTTRISTDPKYVQGDEIVVK